MTSKSCLLVFLAVSSIATVCNSQTEKMGPGRSGVGDKRPELSNVMYIESVKPKSERGIRATPYGLTQKDYEAISSAISMFGTAIPVRVFEYPVFYLDRESRCQVIGTSADFEMTGTSKMVKGSFLLPKDLRTAENVCVISESTASEFFDEANPIGKSIRINKNFFTVVGIAKTKNPTYIKNERVIFIPLSAMRLRFGDMHVARKAGSFEVTNVQLHEIRIYLNKNADARQIFSRVKTLLKKIHPTLDYLFLFDTKN